MTWTERPFALAAFLLLIVAAFGGLSVGIPLVVAQLAGMGSAAATSFGLVPSLALAYGLTSLVAAVAVLLQWPSRTRRVILPQGFVAVVLLGVYLTIVTDPSLLAVAGISGGAAICSIADASQRPSRR